MANLYLTEQGSILRKTGERLIVEKEGEVLLEVQCHKIDTILIFGNVQVTTQAISELFEHNIELALLTHHGRLKGQLTPMKSKNIVLRMAQYEKYNDPSFSLIFSKTVVSGKIGNCLSVVRQFSYNHPEIELKAEIASIEEARSNIKDLASVESLVGIEGTAARIYFNAFKKMCLSDLSFPGRQKRPPLDPINSMLSLGYTMAFNEINSLLDAMGFDPYIGFFHKIDYGRPSLAADLLEEFRGPLVDRLTLNLVNKKVFTENDFYFNEIEGATYFKKESLKEYFHRYEGHINSPFGHKDDSEGPTFKSFQRAGSDACQNLN